MEHDFPWLPIGTEIVEGAKAGKLLGSGNGYQAGSGGDGTATLVVMEYAGRSSQRVPRVTLP